MRKIIIYLVLFVMAFNSTLAFAQTVLGSVSEKDIKALKYVPNAPVMTYAFVFDGPSDKNEVVLGHFQKAITKLTAPDFKPSFSKSNVFVGNWTEAGAKIASNKALNSNAKVIISLGYLSTKYLNTLTNKKKFIVTIDQYGLRDFGDGFFNPIQQSAKSVMMFKRLFNFNSVAFLMNESFYKTKKDWTKEIQEKVPGVNLGIVVVSNKNLDSVVNEVKSKYDAVILSPLFNLSEDERKSLISSFNASKIPTFSTVGREDVVNGVLLGTGALDLDRKIAEFTSFSIKGVLNGTPSKPTKVKFYEDQILYINSDTAEAIGWEPHLRILNNAEVITSKKPEVLSLSAVFNELYDNNLDIERKRILIKAARRASAAAILRYLPSFGVTLGYQQYDHDYAQTVKLSIPEKTGVFKMGIDQVIYSPALVTNILIKKKMVDFSKYETTLKEQAMGIDIALMYIDVLMLENMINVQREYVKESRENLAIARVREQMGKCGQEEALRWAAQLSVSEQSLLDMKAELNNLKIGINKILYKDQAVSFELAPLKANDPAFYTSEIHIIDYVTTANSLEKFTQMLVEEAYRVAPELAKLRAAIKIKDYESGMYYQKFILPDAKLSLEYTSLMNREFGGPSTVTIPGLGSINMGTPAATNGRIGIFAQWTPIEGGTKIAEIGRVKAEKEELKLYEKEVKTAIEQHIRDTINKALAGYFSIEKNYKASYTSGENYHRVKDMYLKGEAPIAQVVDAQKIYLDSKVKAMNSQYTFFKELVWVQRGICAVDWTHASPEAKAFIQSVKDNIERKSDIELL